jgi:hypothetical protein
MSSDTRGQRGGGRGQGRGRGREGQRGDGRGRGRDTNPPTLSGRSKTFFRGGRSTRTAGLYSNTTARREINYGTLRSTTTNNPFGPQKSPLDPPEYLTQALRSKLTEQPTLLGIPAEDDSSESSTNTDVQTDPLRLPEDYAYDAESNTEAEEEDKETADKEPDLTKAIATLIPLATMTPLIITLRNTMNRATQAFSTANTSYATFDGNPDLIRKNVNIKPTFVVPHGIDAYPTTLKPIYETLITQFDALVINFKKEASQLIHKGHETTCFKHRLDRIRLLTSQLINNLGLGHVEYYKMKNNLYPQKQPTTATQPSATETTGPLDLELATSAVHQLWNKLDLQMLEYLDINRKVLIENFVSAHKPTDYTKLNEDNKNTVDFVTNTILGYIKPATCLYSLQKSNTAADVTLEAKLIALQTARASNKAQEAVEKVLDQANLPKENTTLEATIVRIFDARANKLLQAQLKKTTATKTPPRKEPRKDPLPKPNTLNPTQKGRGLRDRNCF